MPRPSCGGSVRQCVRRAPQAKATRALPRLFRASAKPSLIASAWSIRRSQPRTWTATCASSRASSNAPSIGRCDTACYGTGALLGSGIKRVVNVYWLKELGLAQAVWVLDFENFGPFLVESDLSGRSLFERENTNIAPHLAGLYAGTRPATLRRFGETDNKTDKLI
jgi:hypothetical protein